MFHHEQMKPDTSSLHLLIDHVLLIVCQCDVIGLQLIQCLSSDSLI